MRRPKLSSGAKAKERLKVDKVRHALWVEDLQRYGIQCVEVDEYEDVDEILRAVELRLAGRSVFVSGSLPISADPHKRSYAEAVAREVGRVLAEHGKRLVSGFGLVVGSAVMAGALGVILRETAPNLEKSLLLRPFPQEPPSGVNMNEFKRRYRDGMIQQAGICIFICGLKENGTRSASLDVASGVLDEFESAKQYQRIILPIGATGGAAKVIWDQVDKELTKWCPHISRKDYNRLNDVTTFPKDLAVIVSKVIVATDKASLAVKKSRR